MNFFKKIYFCILKFYIFSCTGGLKRKFAHDMCRKSGEDVDQIKEDFTYNKFSKFLFSTTVSMTS